MAEVEEPQFTSLKDRISALNQQKSACTTTFGKRAPPPVPKPHSSSTNNTSRPAPPSRGQTINNPPIPTYGSAVDKVEGNLPIGKHEILPPPLVDRDQRANSTSTKTLALPGRGLPPPLPGRKASQPNLPPRNGSVSTQDERRGSNASSISTNSTSNMSLTRTKTGSSITSISSMDASRKLPPTLADAKLPPLPPSRREREEKEKEVKVPLISVKSAPIIPIRPIVGGRDSAAAVPVRPIALERDSAPKLPSRPQLPSRPSSNRAEAEEPAAPPRKLPPPTASRNALTMGFNTKPKVPSQDTRPTPTSSSTPPPIPLSSKPTKSAILEVKNRPPPPPPTECLLCRDFSRPDQLASLHPRETLPQQHDMTAYLASVLCAPFQSHTDKARAIFTWLHHNVAYDCYSFFNNCVKHQEPSDTISSGLAVCAGYAGLFAAIALKAGLECVVVGGHGKGYGHVELKPEDPIPKYEGNHAWNAVRIDDGEWKLIDACWGAGALGEGQSYNKRFEPTMFTFSNEDFGLSHFPDDARHFYRKDYSIPTWESYVLGPEGREGGEKVTVYSGAAGEHGISISSFTPRVKSIRLANYSPEEVLRFQYSNACEHWKPEKHGKGKPMPIVLSIGGVDGRKEDFVPFETNGYWWWVDIRVKDLGCRGKEVKCLSVDKWDGRSGRGVRNREFLAKRNVGMAFSYIAQWKLV